MATLDFLYGAQDAELIVNTSDSNSTRFPGLSFDLIKHQCPSLGDRFKRGEDGIFRAEIEAASTDCIVHFLRYMYTNGYVIEDHIDISSCRLSIHPELFSLGKDLCYKGLIDSARANFLIHADFACSQRTPPIDLPYTIRYMYKHLSSETSLLETLWSYCCQNFTYHRLMDIPEFKDLAWEVPKFTTDLVRAAFMRHHTDEGAADIIKFGDLTSPSWKPSQTYNEFLGDLCKEFYDNSDSPDKAAEIMERKEMYASAGFVLVHRPKGFVDPASADEASDTDNFVVVRRPKPAHDPPSLSQPVAPTSFEPSGMNAGSILGGDVAARLDQANNPLPILRSVPDANVDPMVHASPMDLLNLIHPGTLSAIAGQPPQCGPTTSPAPSSNWTGNAGKDSPGAEQSSSLPQSVNANQSADEADDEAGASAEESDWTLL